MVIIYEYVHEAGVRNQHLRASIEHVESYTHRDTLYSICISHSLSDMQNVNVRSSFTHTYAYTNNPQYSNTNTNTYTYICTGHPSTYRQ